MSPHRLIASSPHRLPTGGIIIDKPEGMTSHDVVAKVRRILGTKRIGHAGTLDPFATGVLLLCIGPATRLAQFLVGLSKEYRAVVRLGFATDTQDRTGAPIAPVRSSKELTEEDVLRVLEEFRGEQLQTPPMYSAKKVAGERLYRAAREGRTVERQPVKVTVYSIEPERFRGRLLSLNEDGTADMQIHVECSSGTYVRTLAGDIGDRLGVGAHLAELRRTAVGGFRIDRAISLERLEAAGVEEKERVLMPSSYLVAHLPVVQLEAEGVRRVLNGREVKVAAGIDGLVRLCNEQGELIAIAEVDALEGTARPKVVLPADAERG